ncbi:MAG: hypothetical protein V8R57_02475 [Evtepia sp.]
MIGNRIFYTKSAGIEVVGIVDEIMAYVEDQHKKGILSPEFYLDTLLLVSEILPYLKNQEVWIDLGYRLCRYFKQNLESYGYHPFYSNNSNTQRWRRGAHLSTA